MASYAERIERYIERHPGASIQEARGHGSTPERPGHGESQERYADYYERRQAAEDRVNELKADKWGLEADWNRGGTVEHSTHSIPIVQLEAAASYDSLDDYADDMGGWDEIDDGFGYYH